MGLTERALRELMRMLETGKLPSDEAAASDLYFAVREALENRRILSDRTAERDQLNARLEAAERERDERTTMAARAQEALRYVMNGLPTNDAVWSAYGNADSARAWLAARDAQQRREGAAEWIEGFCVDLERQPQGPLFGGVLEMLRAEAQRLREGGE